MSPMDEVQTVNFKLLNFVLFWKYLKNLNLNILTENSLAYYTFLTLKWCKVFRISKCQQQRLVKPWLNFGLNLSFKFHLSFTGELKKQTKWNIFSCDTRKRLKWAKVWIHSWFFMKYGFSLISRLSKLGLKHM